MTSQYFALLASRVSASLVSALTFIWVARLSGTVPVGHIGVITGAGAFVFLIADFGMGTFVSRARARTESSDVANCLLLNILTTTVFGGLFGAATVFYLRANGASLILAILVIALALEKNTDTALSVAIADGHKLVPALATLARRLAALAVFAGLLSGGVGPVAAFSLGQALGSALGQVVWRIWAKRQLHDLPQGSMGMACRLIPRLTPYVISNAAAGARNLDALIVRLFTNQVQVGLFSAAARITNPFRLIPSTLTVLVLPHAARMPRNYEARRLSRRLCALFLGSLGVVVPFSFLGPWLCSTLLGPEFHGAGTILQLMLIGLPIVALSSPLGSILQARGQARFVAMNGIVFAVVTLVLMIGGAHYGGGAGAVIATTLSFCLKCAALVIRIERTLKPRANTS